MLIALEVVGILSMLTFMFIGIWGFIILKQTYSQLKYRNYLLEKLNHNISGIGNSDISVSCKEDTEDLNLDNSETENTTDI